MPALPALAICSIGPFFFLIGVRSIQFPSSGAECYAAPRFIRPAEMNEAYEIMRRSLLAFVWMTTVVFLSGCSKTVETNVTQSTEQQPVAEATKTSEVKLPEAASAASPAVAPSAEFLKVISGNKLPDKKQVVANTELPGVMKLKQNKVCYVYNKYAVVVAPTEDVGEDIKIIARNSPVDESYLSDPVKAPAYFKVEEGDNYFFGIYADYLFIDSGTAPEPRGLGIYDLAQKKEIYDGSYSSPIKLEKDLRLTYYEEVEQSALKGKKVDCPQAEQWKNDGLGVAYEEKVSLDLKTLKKSRSGNIRCAARE